jgi:hypothetical protein
MAIRRRRWTRLPLPADIADRKSGTEVDVALVLAVDSSGSISQERLTMQFQGYLDAIRHPSFIDAARAGSRGRIGLTFVTWTDSRRQEQAVPWQLIDDAASAEQFCRAVQDAPPPIPGWTSISGAIDFCVGLLLTSGYATTRRVVDVSGDGANNDGRPVAEARDDAVAAGIIINGLPIIEVEPDLEAYYRKNVIGGLGSFVVVARDTGSFGEAIRHKLLVEVAGVAPTGKA